MNGVKKKLFTLLIITVVLTVGLPGWVYGAPAAKAVTISIPTYSITVNGVKIDLAKSKYPFIVYNGVTYFPMTYSDCRVLGLETEWKGDTEGLFIEKTGITAAYLPYSSSAANKGSYKATVTTFPINVNGKVIDNSKEQYPLLSFRDITYFPMTWTFAVDAFGWDYNFSPKEGLVIKSDNIKVEQRNFGGSNSLKDDEGKITSATVAKDDVYYTGKKGQIIQTSLSDPTKTKTVYQLPVDDYSGSGKNYVMASVYVENGEAYLFYHTGGAVMGSDHLFRLNHDGSATEIQNGYSKVKIFGDKVFTYWTGHAPGSGNLLREVGEESIPVGDPGYLYGWAWQIYPDGGRGGGGSDDVILEGENLYILAYNMKEEGTEKNGIYCVNINTNETVRMSKHEAMGFQRIGDDLYYVGEGALYRVSMKDGKETFVKQLMQSALPVRKFAVLNGKCYWKDNENEGLYDEDGNNINEGAMLTGMKIAGDQDEYLICTFYETEESKYRVMIFDQSGAIAFKTSDTTWIGSIDITGTTVTFVNQTTGTICSAKLQ